ncbi:hypothetical protein L2E82_25610 [Cichorium intybus]|uniref:Uncharacterized protein n=1 Tax=Cichorium intybus TaxID=13427 RepID=A0ACB9E3P1_CICIN|nr:hypothetical protein L2E82_25610 [Cichorium intybus]
MGISVLGLGNENGEERGVSKDCGEGVESASLMGSDKDKIAVTGEAIDAIQLAKLLRKRVGCTEIVSLGPVKEDERPNATATAINRTQTMYYYPPNYNNYGVWYNVYEAP